MSRATTATATATSADGTTIAYESVGAGPPVVLIGGAFNDRTTTRALADALAPAFTAVSYDRRGRGASGDTPPYAPAREIEDLTAVIAALTAARAGANAADGLAGRGAAVAGGGPAVGVFGHSSGAILALEAAAAGAPIARLAVFEPPYVVDEAVRSRPPDDVAARVRDAVAAGDRAAATRTFLVESVGVPSEVVAMMAGDGDIWPGMLALAHTLPYDLELTGPGQRFPAARLASLTVPTLALDGSETAPWLRAGAAAVAATVPGAARATIEGQDHAVLHAPDALVPVLAAFFG